MAVEARNDPAQVDDLDRSGGSASGRLPKMSVHGKVTKEWPSSPPSQWPEQQANTSAEFSRVLPPPGRTDAVAPGTLPAANSPRVVDYVPVLGNLPSERVRRRLLALSFIFVVLLPTIIFSLYHLVLASDRYTAGAAFSVQGAVLRPAGSNGLLGAAAGLSGAGSADRDTHTLVQYLQSRELLERLGREYDYRAAFGDENVDFVSRLGMDPTIDEAVRYWNRMIAINLDERSGIIDLEVQAFDPDDAQRIAALVLKYCHQLIASLSEQYREVGIKSATKEVSKAEAELRAIRTALREVQKAESTSQLGGAAANGIQTVADLQRQLVEVQARLSVLVGTIDDSAPVIQELRQQEDALTTRIAKQLSAKTDGSKAADPNGQLALEPSKNREALELEQEFAEQTYKAALASLERARATADQQQRHLAVFRSPVFPESPVSPIQLSSVFTLFFSLLAAWIIATVCVYWVRSRLR